MTDDFSLLNVDNLCVSFKTEQGRFRAVDRVGFSVQKGEIVGLVGESGCGKSVTALSLTRLLPCPPARIAADGVYFLGVDILGLKAEKLREIRGRRIGMIFQEPGEALSPLYRIGGQLMEALRFHYPDISREQARKTAVKWLGRVGISDPETRRKAYPFELSGGMQQRVMIAAAMMLDPDLLIADEPTTALDVTTQARIFQLIFDMKKKDMSILLITHDMGVVWETCDRVLVMYAAKIVESADVADLFAAPAHPYTRGL